MNKDTPKLEEVILSIQGHWIAFLRPATFLALGGVTFFLIHHTGQFITPGDQAPQFLLYFFSYITLLISVHFFFILLLQCLISTVLITNKRIIEIKYLPFVMDDINHIEISKIDEIKKIKHGLLKNILNYGEVSIKISNTGEVVNLNYVNKPSKFVNLVEAIKFGGPLEKLDLQGMGASVSEKYASLKI